MFAVAFLSHRGQCPCFQIGLGSCAEMFAVGSAFFKQGNMFLWKERNLLKLSINTDVSENVPCFDSLCRYSLFGDFDFGHI